MKRSLNKHMKTLLVLFIVASDALAQATGNPVPSDVPSDYTSLYH
jgi:hypothetical protein